MNVIPVIDLKGGHVVHAKYGDRKSYMPIQSELTVSSEPIAVVSALRSLYPFDILYIADLDAIQGDTDHATTVKDIQKIFPTLKIWLDAGFSSAEPIDSWKNSKVKIVLGSESFTTVEQYETLYKSCAGNCVLSLDFKNNQFLGPQELLNVPSLWPRDLIVMSLDQVGSMMGPNLNILRQIKEGTDNNLVYAAGGVRSKGDLLRLKEENVAGALIASALHNQAISKHDLDAL